LLPKNKKERYEKRPKPNRQVGYAGQCPKLPFASNLPVELAIRPEHRLRLVGAGLRLVVGCSGERRAFPDRLSQEQERGNTNLVRSGFKIHFRGSAA
jgi:hypothetical protein